MHFKILALIFVITLAVSFIGLFLFASEGGFGGRGRGMVNETIPRSLWLVLFVAPLFVAFSALAYSLAFPDLSTEKSKEQVTTPNLGAVLRVLNEDERKVVETLVAEGGIMLQKNIRWKTSLSRVKTHRVLFRLAKRGIVSTEKYYNTNKIFLAEWITKKSNKNESS